MTNPLLYTIITIVVMMGVLQGACAYLIYVERKVAAYMQDRIGPNRVGPLGLLQPIADGLKFLFKEEVIPGNVDKLLFLLAPAVAVGTATFAFAIVPFGPTSNTPGEYQFVIAPGVDIGILFTFAIGSLAVYGIILGGWSSNNKYSFLGAMRSSAQIISYEIPLGMSILGVVLMAGSLNLERIIDQQVRDGWNVFYQPLAFLLFLLAVMAECNRLPFDLPEAEQELIGGYHTEYSGLKFGLFFLGEYTHVITTALLISVVFWGGWYFPGLVGPESGIILKLLSIWLKALAFILFYMFIRWTIPRFRFDQLMGLAWRTLIPLALANVVCVMLVKEFRLNQWLLLPASLVLLFGATWLSLKYPQQPRKRVLTATVDGRQSVAAAS
jgi:NADH-quinone oxidoreductase subunit H